MFYIKIFRKLQILHPDNIKPEELSNLLVELSAHIDYGRLFFENIEINGKEKNKPKEFRGYRPANLELLVFYYNV